MNKKLLAVAFALVMAVVLSGSSFAADTNTSVTDELQTTSSNTALPDPYVVETGISYTTIQAAIDSVFTQEGMTIQVEAGTYNEDVLVWKSLSIIGASPATTIVNSFFVTSTGSGSEITGFTVNGGTGEAITLDNADGCYIHDNIITGDYSAGVALVDSSNNDVYSNIIDGLFSNLYYGIYLENSDYNYIHDNVISFCNRDGIWIKDSNNIDIYDHNLIEFNGENGILVENSDYVTISTNIIYANIGDGIYVTDSYGTTIHLDNSIYDNENGIELENSDSTEIDDNLVHNNNYYGLYAFSSDDIEITNNQIHDNYTGIRCDNGLNSIISNNTVYNHDYVGIFLVSNDNSLTSYNELYNNDYGIALNSSDNNNISNNNVHNNIWGVWLGFANNNIISTNNIHNNTSNGIGMVDDSNNNSITTNIISYNGINGIYADYCDYLEINDNTIDNNTGDGINLRNCSYCLIDPNSIYGNTENGIEIIDSDYMDIYDNEIWSNGLSGINLTDCTEFDIYGNMIYNNTENGIEATNTTDVEIDDNSIYSNFDGVYLTNCSEIGVTHNVIYQNVDDGIEIRDTTKVSVLENNIYNNDYGVYIANSSDDVNVNFNRIVDNTTYDLLYGNSATGDVDATLNWWGYNNAVDIAPNIADNGSGTLTWDPWIILSITANPTVVGIGGTSTIIADLLQDSDGVYHNPAFGVVPYDGPANFTTDLGTIVDANFVNGVATSTLTNLNTAGVATVESTVDHQTVSTTITVNPAATIAQIIAAAAQVKTFYELNGFLPANVLVGAQSVTMPEFLYLLTTATRNISLGNLNPINIIPVNPAPSPGGSYTPGSLVKASYLTVANNIRNFIIANGRAPNYAQTNLGKIPFSKLVYMYSKVINFYGPNIRLPNYVTI